MSAWEAIDFRGLLLVLIIVILLLVMALVIRWSNSGSNSELFNFKRDVERSGKKNLKQEKKEKEEEKTFLGISNSRQDIYVSNNAKHIFVCGTTGSGKTVALSNFIKSGIENDYPMLIIDGKGDIGENSLLDIVGKLSTEKADKKVYVVNLVNPETSDKYNPFKNTGPDIVKDMIINMTTWSEEHYKYNAERYIQRLINLLVLSEIPISLDSITEYISVDAFTKLSKDLEGKSKKITKQEHKANVELTKTSGGIATDAAARFAVIKESGLGQIFDEAGIDIYTALKENAIILFILNPLDYPEMSPLIGRLLIIDSKKAISLFYRERKKRIFYLLDEINVYATDNMFDLINKSRSANITCILATQSLSDLEKASGEAFRKQIIENCNNYILLRQNESSNAENWASILGTRHTMNATYQIKGSNGNFDSTELGSLRRTREFIYHPDDIKRLRTGQAIYLSRDEDFHTKIKINKPF